ncbi:MAG: hypothetical protein HY537_00390 [Deltaproteobacteria bacterium]|nr:hypothetical protein [Deltaproteobacteria bacterium]
MKRVLITIITLMSMNSFANFMPSQEAVLVKEINQFINMMPPLPPTGPRVLTSLNVDVKSSGCTRDEDFQIRVGQLPHAQVLTVVRIKPDYCEAIEHTVTVELRTENLVNFRQKPAQVSNPLLGNVQIVH